MMTKLRTKISKKALEEYTYMDDAGLSWRFKGSRPISSLGDIIKNSVKNQIKKTKSKK